jgi:signal transduction histidine kinase
VIGANVSDMHLSADKKDIKLVSGIKGPIFLFADKNMLNTILRNLLGNAVKFTQKSGTVTIDAVYEADELTVSVKDTGIGIPADKINELFRIDTKYTRPGTFKESGTGLGLKLCKEFIEIQGGKIWVESVVNAGSKFSFTIPISGT